MNFADLRSACVVRYPYLWARQADGGETEGRKGRPVAVGVRIERARDGDMLLLFPITSQEPGRSRLAAEIPEAEKRRGGLDSGPRLWIVLDEYNLDVVGKSFYLEPVAPLGRFSKAFFLPLLRTFIARRLEARSVDRRG